MSGNRKHLIAPVLQFLAVFIVSTVLWAVRDFDGYPFLSGVSVGCLVMLIAFHVVLRRDAA